MIRRSLLLLLVVTLLATPGVALGLSVNDVAREVRCPTCNTPLDVSSAPVAQDMKAFIARRIDAGWSKQRIIDALVDEFGPRVLATPPKSGFDLMVWIIPAVFIGLGLLAVPLVALSWTRRSPASPGPVVAITDEERRELDARLGSPPR